MNMRSTILGLLALGVLTALVTVARGAELTSPDGRLSISVAVENDNLHWCMSRDGKAVVTSSRMGIEFVQSNFPARGLERLAKLKVIGTRTESRDVIWTTRLYRREKVRDRHNELLIELEESDARMPVVKVGEGEVARHPRRLNVVLRAYDEGVAFRYEIPRQSAFEGFELGRELTEWRFPGDPQVWATSYRDHNGGQEEKFERMRMSALDRGKVIGMPVVVECPEGRIALTEAALRNWAGMMFRASEPGILQAELSPAPEDAHKENPVTVVSMTPARSPWRVMIVGDDEIDLLKKNDLIVNLNDPPDPSLDFSWVKSGASSWDWWAESNNSLSTERTLKLVDFAAEMGWPYHTIDGGWYGFARRPNHGPNVPLEPRRGFDLPLIVEHARRHGVGIWVWVHWKEIEAVGIEATFAKLRQWGVVGVKTDFLERQDQWMVNWCERVCRAAARHHMMVNFHGTFKPTGTERTWPNNLTREGIRGNEMNIFDSSIDPVHCATLPFTRFLLGPADFTPGGFGNVHSESFIPQVGKGHVYGDETDRCPHWAEEQGTRAHAIAQCVAFDSPLMTLCDWPERYRGADGFEFLKRLPSTWKNTRPLEGRCGEYYVVLRESFDGRFYLAAMTVRPREIEVKLDFVGSDGWKMRTVEDAGQRTEKDATAVVLRDVRVKPGMTVAFSLVAEGGALAILEK